MKVAPIGRQRQVIAVTIVARRLTKLDRAEGSVCRAATWWRRRIAPRWKAIARLEVDQFEVDLLKLSIGHNDDWVACGRVISLCRVNRRATDDAELVVQVEPREQANQLDGRTRRWAFAIK